MIDSDFRTMRDESSRARFDMCDAKSIGYTMHDPDRLINFKRMADRFGVSVEVVQGIYLMKHMDSIVDWIRTGEQGSESIEGRIDDAQNYLDLLRARIREKE